MSIQRAISLYDIMCYPEAKKAIQEQDKKTLEKILYSLGLDVKEPYELEECLHRPLMKDGNEPWMGPRYVGNERQDKAYLESGNSTWENRIDACRDPELRADLLGMSKTGSSDRTWSDKGVAKKVAHEERKRGI